MELIDLIKTLPQLGVDGILIMLVYLLRQEVKSQKKMLIECLQSGGKISEETLDEVDKTL